MMKRCLIININKRIAVFIVWIFVLTAVNAQEVTIGGLKYYLFADTHEAALNADNLWVGELDIPSEVSYNDERYIVNGISVFAFYSSHELTKVRIPKTIDHVIHHILSDNGSLAGYVPTDCMNPFLECTSLETILVDDENPAFCAVNNVLFNKDGTKLYCYPAGIKTESYVVPEGVTWIGFNAFANNKNLISVELPETVNILCSGVFSGCMLEVLVIRGILDDECVNEYLFGSLNETAKIYVPSTELNRYRSQFNRTFLPLEDYTNGVRPTVYSSDKLAPAYNLGGRHIQGTQNNVIIIQNGKKKLVK